MSILPSSRVLSVPLLHLREVGLSGPVRGISQGSPDSESLVLEARLWTLVHVRPSPPDVWFWKFDGDFCPLIVWEVGNGSPEPLPQATVCLPPSHCSKVLRLSKQEAQTYHPLCGTFTRNVTP